PDAPIVDVPEVELNAFCDILNGRRRASGTIALSPPCYSRLDVVTERIIAQHHLEVIVVRQGMRARTYQRHLAPQDIQELRQFVDARRSQQASDRRDARVVALRLDDVTAILLDLHGPEFQYDELFAVEPAPDLPKDDWTRTVQLDRNGRKRHEWQEENQHE